MNKKLKKILILLVIIDIIAAAGILVYKYILYSNKSTSSYKYVGDLKNGFLSVSDGTYYGYIDSSGNIIFPLEKKLPDKIESDVFLDDYYYAGGLAKYYDNSAYGIINDKGEIIIEAQYSNIKIYSKDVIIASTPNETYVINSSQEPYFESRYIQLTTDENDLEHFIAEDNALKYGIIDINGNTIIDFQYDNIYYVYNNDKDNYIYVATNSNEYSIYNKNLEQIFIDNISAIYWFEDNVVCYLDNNNVVHTYNIVTNKEETYDSKYRYVNYYVDGLAFVSDNNNKYGYIDENKNIVIDLKYTYQVSNFNYNYASVCNYDNNSINCGVIDKTGNTIIKEKYNDIAIINDKYLVVEDSNNKYIINYKEEKQTDTYSEIQVVDDGKYYIVTNNKGKYGVLDSNFNIIYDISYNNIKYNEGKFILKDRKGIDIK